jgi:glycosyltransferase involved in cell wall biosynthesis
MSFTIIIAVKNEAENLDLILPILVAKFPDAEILAIDGHSTDDSVKILDKHHIKHLIQPGKGKGDALRMGAAHATHNAIIFFDADCSHDPDDIQKLIDPIINGDYVHVSGSRMLGGSSELFNDIGHLFRLFGSLIINYSISYKFNYRITDAQNGLRAFNRDFYISLNTQSDHTTIEQETVGKTLSLGYPILELPTHEYCRLYGESKINVLKHGWSYLKMLIDIMFWPKKSIPKTPLKNQYKTEWYLN